MLHKKAAGLNKQMEENKQMKQRKTMVFSVFISFHEGGK
jgi:hypothetical protein